MALWLKIAKNIDQNIGPLARPFALSLVALTRSLTHSVQFFLHHLLVEVIEGLRLFHFEDAIEHLKLRGPILFLR